MVVAVRIFSMEKVMTQDNNNEINCKKNEKVFTTSVRSLSLSVLVEQIKLLHEVD